MYGNLTLQGGRSYEQYDSRTVAGEYLPANGQQKQLAGDETADPVILRELVEKLEVYQIEGTGKNRTQRVVIHYRFVGCLQIPEWHRKRKVTLESRQGVAVNYLPTTA